MGGRKARYWLRRRGRPLEREPRRKLLRPSNSLARESLKELKPKGQVIEGGYIPQR
ncbi:MAG: hypothetical protein IMW96_01155 [Thermoanaerobacteraceae bacterium]|nr:hypothetical protein [Thermoanaerobacteraceae bacterium]